MTTTYDEERNHDDEIKEALHEIDNDEMVTLTSWEADFLENILFKQTFPLTARQVYSR